MNEQRYLLVPVEEKDEEEGKGLTKLELLKQLAEELGYDLLERF